MNERAVELYKQALKFAYETAGVDAEKGTILASLTAGRFAQLIVRECAKIGEDYGDDGLSSDPEGNRYPLNAGIAIRKHFGVEE